MNPSISLLIALSITSLAADKQNLFCEQQLYDKFHFISQPAPYEYLLFVGDEYYQAHFNGTQFSNMPTGPHRMFDTYPGLQSFGPSLSPSNEQDVPVKFIFLLFVSPNNSHEVLQFVDDQILLWTGPHSQNMIVQLADNCPKNFDTIIHRSVQPHLLVRESSYSNLTFDSITREFNCSNTVPIFSEDIVKGFAVDAAMSKEFESTKVYKWLKNNWLCTQKLTGLGFPCASFLIDEHWRLFGCPNPNAAKSNVGLIIAILMGTLIGLILVGLLIYYVATLLFRSHKEQVSKIMLNSQIE